MARELLSCVIDDEASALEREAASSHRRRCQPCAAWWVEAESSTELLREWAMRPAPSVAGAVLARVRPTAMRAPRRWRVALAMVALAEVALALPGLLAGRGSPSVHDARHLGSFGVAMALGLLYVSWRPAKAFGLLPIVASLAATIAAASMVDLFHGEATAAGEAHHLLELSGLALVWLIAGHPLPNVQPVRAVARRRVGSVCHVDTPRIGRQP